MISQVLTFASDVNTSLQIGDVVYYSPQGTYGSFNTVNNVGTIVTFGVVTAIYNNGSTAPAVPPYSIVVLYDETNPATPVPAPADYIMFAKNKEVNSSSLKGYYAEIKFENYSTDKIELFAVTSEASESSK
tara:strand:+ start:2603 stop:2995 length:393 start_codon:yes stop_codon:yes gene_type:complete